MKIKLKEQIVEKIKNIKFSKEKIKNILFDRIFSISFILIGLIIGYIIVWLILNMQELVKLYFA